MDNIEAVISEIKSGDKSLYKSVVEKYQRSIFIYCHQMLKNIQEAEDAAQDIFIRAYEKLDLYDSSASFSAWLYKIAYNHCISLLRRRKILQFVPFEDMRSQTRDDTSTDNELSEQLTEALKTLNATDRSILFLRVLDERSYDEIGDIVNLKPATVRKRYERSRKKVISNLSSKKGVIENGYITSW